VGFRAKEPALVTVNCAPQKLGGLSIRLSQVSFFQKRQIWRNARGMYGRFTHQFQYHALGEQHELVTA
jgi:hypothetical protein